MPKKKDPRDGGDAGEVFIAARNITGDGSIKANGGNAAPGGKPGKGGKVTLIAESIKGSPKIETRGGQHAERNNTSIFRKPWAIIVEIIFLFAAFATIYQVFIPSTFKNEIPDVQDSILTKDQIGDNYIIKTDVSDHYQAELVKLMPRSLTSEQRSFLLDRLSSKQGRIGFMSKLFDGESKDFTDELEQVFRDAGWIIMERITNSTNDLPGFVTVKRTHSENLPDEDLLDLLNYVCRSLYESGVLCKQEDIPDKTWTFHDQRPPDALYVIVGRKGNVE